MTQFEDAFPNDAILTATFTPGLFDAVGGNEATYFSTPIGEIFRVGGQVAYVRMRFEVLALAGMTLTNPPLFGPMPESADGAVFLTQATGTFWTLPSAGLYIQPVAVSDHLALSVWDSTAGPTTEQNFNIIDTGSGGGSEQITLHAWFSY